MRKSLLYPILGILVLLGLASVIAYSNRPTVVAQRAVEELGKAQTLAFTTDIGLENSQVTADLLGEEGSVRATFVGHLERQLDTADTIAGDIVISTQVEGVSVQIDGDLRLINDTIYVLIEKTPRILPALAVLKGQWLMFPRNATPGGSEPETLGQLFVSVDRVGQEQINNVATIKYNAVATDEAVVRMMDSLASVLGAELSEAQTAELRAGVASVKEVPVELWIDRWSSRLRQLRTQLAVPGGNTIHFTLTISEVNQPVTIQTPEGAKTLEQLAQELQTANSAEEPIEREEEIQE